jgi:hypothetical protein
MCTHHLEGAGGSENSAASKVTGKSISSFDRSIERVHVPLEGVSHAAWPENLHESAAKETICWQVTAANIECAARRPTGHSQRAKL